ncbi:FAD:protein FMN transferase [Stenotrophomonas sp. YAU14A_MKIMI4_1]|uniref:FAD:protein FMN transferase n=1 Tax=Stenotrophomonas sp. YAU14A_MKIMI4_1 TaxID=2072408 RepID=UPI000D5416F1|nr:FAD:protein FMN transferase [Stenotrophomonas sp. YAU14A_MKIMI4_1]AWH28372.1 thiamine biosynthesis protein ApbE [Stenotrophomonas sp. YAU14A_MKIMI4_1]
MTDTSLDIARLGGTTMGTTWSVSLVAPRQRDLHPLHAGIQARLDAVVAQMSTWEPGSDLSRYNSAPAGQHCVLPAETRHVLACAQTIAAASDGAFDPTVGPLVALWGFGAHAGPRALPSTDVLQATRERCGWQRLQWQGDALLQPGGLELDLSAIAKGFGVDHVAAWLRSQQIDAALIEVGGELAGYGHKPDGQPWRVLVESAPEEDAASELPPRVLALHGKAVATSGDRWHQYSTDGQAYSHSLDPRTGMPVRQVAAAVTVVADDAMHADAWATALTVLGQAAGMALAEREGLAVRYLQRSTGGPQEHLSSAFQRLLDEQAA